MIAKGHDLPNVTLVGIVDCDVGLHMPDFRAAERGFQLLAQVSGRAGRREKQGRVILQTRIPDHISIVKTVQENYDEFATSELQTRRELDYPPFSRLLRIIVASEDRTVAQQFAAQVTTLARQLAARDSISVLGPVATPIEKIRRHWRFHALCKSSSSGKLQSFLVSLRSSLSVPRQIRLIFDLDPQDML
jgi:primosomal protein N' (replication factor Y)